jgi:type IV pilus assembly protein PilW
VSFAATHRPPVRAIAGFSLIEIMVGMVIAMIGILVMTQIFALSEGQKRTTTGGNDAQNNGAIALFGLQREMREAGWGTSDQGILGCDVQVRTGFTLPAMAPVTINHSSLPAGDAGSDTLLIVYASTLQSPEGDIINAQSADNKSYGVNTPTSFSIGDLVIAKPQVRPDPCSGTGKLVVDSVAAVAAPNVTVATGAAGMSNGALYNFGTALTANAYAVRNGQLTRCNLMDSTANCTSTTAAVVAASWLPIADNIVSMKAQYGRDTRTTIAAPAYSIVSSYDSLTPGSTADIAAMAVSARPLVCRWARIPAVRMALVARSANFEKTTVTTASPAWDGGTIDLSATTNWGNYRYKVFQTTIPLRNITWMGAPTGC